ncbi:hypothetical protein AIP27_23110, partial [Salmonella enterica]|nr:hypothetical protein [Salmonella enterica]
VIDKYITRHCHSPKGNDFYRKFYVLFVGYHLKYFYAQAKYSNSCFHVDNIMQMFSGVASCLNGNLLSQFTNGNTLLQSLSSLVNYISQDVAGAERIYADLLAQYEKKRIAGSMTYTPRPGARKRL